MENTVFHTTDEMEKRIEELQRQIQLDPGNVSNFVTLALLFVQLQRWREVIDICSQGSQIGHQNSFLHTMRGIACGKLDQYALAAEALSSALQLDPYDVNALLNRSILWIKLKEWHRVVEDSSRLIHVKSNFFQAYINRGIAYHQLEKNEEAMSDLTFVINSSPLDTDKVGLTSSSE